MKLGRSCYCDLDLYSNFLFFGRDGTRSKQNITDEVDCIAKYVNIKSRPKGWFFSVRVLDGLCFSGTMSAVLVTWGISSVG